MSLHNSSYSALNAQQEKLAERVISEFEERLKQPSETVISDHLPAERPLRTAILVELIHLELESKLRSGVAISYRDYFERFPELMDDPDAVAGILRTEWQTRCSLGEVLRIEDLLFGPKKVEHTSHHREQENQNWVRRDAFFARYALAECLGKGSFAAVYKCYDRLLGRSVAVKVPSHPTASKNSEELFLQEARCLSRLKHPHIVQVLDVVTCCGWPLLVTELVEGGTLAQKVRNGISLSESLSIFTAVADAVQYAHDRSVAHHDLKPSNILLTETNTPFISDFGLASFFLPGIEAAVPVHSGTQAYMAPEKRTGTREICGPAADQYSLGVILLELLLNRAPIEFMEGSARHTLQVETMVSISDQSTCNREQLDALIFIGLKAVATSPEDRYRTVAELATAVREIVDSFNRMPLPIPERSRSEQVMHRRTRRGILLSAVLACFVFSSLILWQHDQNQRRELRNFNEFRVAQSGLTSIADAIRTGASGELEAQERSVLLETIRQYEKYLATLSETPSDQYRCDYGECYLDLADHQFAVRDFDSARRSIAQARALNWPLNHHWLVRSPALASRCASLEVLALIQLASIDLESGARSSDWKVHLDLANKIAQDARLWSTNAPNVIELRGRIKYLTALALIRDGSKTDAEAGLEEAIALLDAQDLSPTATWYVAMSHYELGRLRKGQSRADKAIHHFLVSAELFASHLRTVNRDAPDHMVHCYCSAMELALRDRQFMVLETVSESLKAILDQSDIAEHFSADQSRLYKGKRSFLLGAGCAAGERYDLAAAHFSDAISNFSDLLARSKTSSIARDLAASHHGRGNCLEQMKQFDTSMLHFCEAARLRSELCSANPDNPSLTSDLFGTLNRIVVLLDRMPSRPRLVHQMADEIAKSIDEWKNEAEKKKLLQFLILLRAG